MCLFSIFSSVFGFPESQMAKDFGVANYTARKVSEGLVLVIADGTAPYVNTRVTLEQLSWRIWPPRIGLYFDTPGAALPALRPFIISGLFIYPVSLGQVTLIDAAGEHSVKIGATISHDAPPEEWVNSDKAFNAYQQIGMANCMIAPVDAMVPMIFRKAHGPDSYNGCEDWIARNCGNR
jgi:hypothetical protein